MKNFFNHLIRKPTFISIATGLFFIGLILLSTYKLLIPPKNGSADYMIIEMLMIFSIVPIVLFIIDRLLVILMDNVKLAIIESLIFAGFFLYNIFYAD